MKKGNQKGFFWFSHLHLFFYFHLPFGDLHSLPFGLSHPTFCRHAFKATLCGKRASSESSSLVTIENLKLSYIMPKFSFVERFMEHCKIYCVFLLSTSLWFSLCQNMLSYLSQVNSTRNLIFCSGLFRILFEEGYLSPQKKIFELFFLLRTQLRVL